MKPAVLFIRRVLQPKRRDVVAPFAFNLLAEAVKGFRADDHLIATGVVAHMGNRTRAQAMLSQTTREEDREVKTWKVTIWPLGGYTKSEPGAVATG